MGYAQAKLAPQAHSLPTSSRRPAEQTSSGASIDMTFRSDASSALHDHEAVPARWPCARRLKSSLLVVACLS